MGLGPIFRNEAVAIARGARTYRTRMAFGLVLAAVVGGRYWYFAENHRRAMPSASTISGFAQATTESILLIQALCVIALVPPLVSGIVAEERQRRTLPDLLTTRLSAFEIVVGKVAARSISIATWLGIGLPILALLGLFGGVDPANLLLAEAATASTAIALASLTALVSVGSRRPADAVISTYLIAVFWLVASSIAIARPIGIGRAAWEGAALNWVLRTSPAWLMPPFTFGASRVLEMVLAQSVASIALLTIAVARLRPASRRLEPGPRRRGLRRSRRRPPVGDDAMLWKECQASGARRLGSFVVLPTVVLLLAAWQVGILRNFRLEYNFWHDYHAAIDEFFENGYKIGGDAFPVWKRDFWNGHLATISGVLSVPWLLAVAVVAASGISGEREKETWRALLASPVTPWEILRAKLIGPAWGLKAMLVLIGLPWLIGLAMGATHPLGFVFAIVGLGLMTWFSTALGTLCSIRSRSTSSAMVRTVGFLSAANLGVLVPIGSTFRSGPTSWILCMPSTLTQLPLSTYAFAGLSTQDPRHLLRLSGQEFLEEAISGRLCYAAAAIVAANVAFYAILAAILTLACLRSLEIEADRPRRGRRRRVGLPAPRRAIEAAVSR